MVLILVNITLFILLQNYFGSVRNFCRDEFFFSFFEKKCIFAKKYNYLNSLSYGNIFTQKLH